MNSLPEEIGLRQSQDRASQRIYDSSNNGVRKLTPSTADVTPSVAGVISASAFGAFQAVAPGSWIEIYGTGLATTTRGWTSADFSGVNAPTVLSGTSVAIGGKSAYVSYISPTQVNVQVPSDATTGSQELILSTFAGSSTALHVTVNGLEPGLFSPASFNIGGKQRAWAIFPDNSTIVLPTGAISGITSQKAKAGDVITLYGVGFGPVTPSIPAGQLVQQLNTITADYEFLLGGVKAEVQYAGLAPQLVGVYQFNIKVPNVGSADPVPLVVTIAGTQIPQTLYLDVQQ